MNTLDTLVHFISQNLVIIFVGVISLVQIAPIKIDPWTWLMKTVKNALIGDLEDELKTLQKEVLDEKINNKRWYILDFSNSCLQGRLHTEEEWKHCIAELAWYDNFCITNGIPNGVMEECGKYLRTTYQKLLKENNFL